MSHVAVIDIGKTNAKLALVALPDLTEVAVLTRPNTVLPGPPWPHFDVEGHWVFLLDGLAALHRAHGIDAISVTTHGAAGVLLDADGGLAAPVLDYEHTGPDALAADYDALRPDFADTGSPRLPMGLNLGAQLHWMLATDPTLRERMARVLTYPQYWGFRLTGVAATEMTSLGCHTDLWMPRAGRLSPLAERLGLADRIAPTRTSAEVLGPILPDIAARTGLPPDTPVHCGIHDSNASLLPHLMGRTPPFSVVSTGTWVISMAIGGSPVPLDPARDTLINVDAFGNAVPSARFMGGRTYETVVGAQAAEPTGADLASVLRDRVMLLPSVVQGSGPFPDRPATWHPSEPAAGTGARSAATGFHLALMTARCLGLIGHRGTVVVEGPFARNDAFCRMLAAATDSPVTTAGGATGTSQGAALLAVGTATPVADGPTIRPDDATLDPMRSYAAAWTAAVGD